LRKTNSSRRHDVDIKTHKALVAAIPEDLRAGEKIEVSLNGDFWQAAVVLKDCKIYVNGSPLNYIGFPGWTYARRRAPKLKRPVRSDGLDADDIAENGRNVGLRDDIELSGCIPGDEVMVKLYRPWRLGDKIPAPLMVRRKTWRAGTYRYAFPDDDGCYVLENGVGLVGSTFDAFLEDWVQVDGSPCGVEEEA
jgi:hypothetical protein